MTAEFTFIAPDESATWRLGACLADALPDGAVVALIGTLGAGKTRLVQAVAAASGVDVRSVVSPTFVVVNEYHGRRPIYHFDAYRLKDDDEFLELGPNEYFEGQGITFVEWADRVERCMPREILTIEIAVTGETERQFKAIGIGTNYSDAIRRVQAALS
jgi:tRNA threonylcarbamoyladenosine biosynthesis protein TsaE